MILLPILLANALVAPDAAPLSEAVARCDRGAVASQAQAEPVRRAEFAKGVYAEQRAIATERAALDASSLTDELALNAARSALDARQRRLSDFVLSEIRARGALCSDDIDNEERHQHVHRSQQCHVRRSACKQRNDLGWHNERGCGTGQ
mgnify:CR=1 FL=1